MKVLILLVSLLPRSVLRQALFYQWQKSLPQGDQIRLNYWGATGNKQHHAYSWADEL